MKRFIGQFIPVMLLILAVFFADFGGVCIGGNRAYAEEKPIPTINSVLGGGPAISGTSAIVMEVHSGAILFAKNCTASMAPVSLTKLVTALIVLEEGSLADTVNCSYTAINNIGKNVTRIGLVAEERVELKDLLYASMVASADEATYAMGEHVGGSMKKFLKLMNTRMEALGAVNSEFTSCTGTGTTKQTSCAYDIGLVACKLGCRRDFLEIAGAKWYQVPATNLKEARTIAQTHKFIRKTLKYDAAIAGKSGGQSADGTYGLCTFAERDGMRLVAIVLGCPNDESSYDDTISMLNYSFENYVCYSMKTIERESNPDYAGFFDECAMFNGMKQPTLSIDSGATVVLPYGASPKELVKRVEYSVPEDYVHGKNVIGQLIYSYRGMDIGRTDIIYYNEENPLSQKDFNAVWPKFLLSPSVLKSVGGEGAETVIAISGSKKTTPTPTPRPSTITRWEGNGKVEAGVKGGALCLGLFLLCLIGIYIVMPMYTMSKRRKRRG